MARQSGLYEHCLRRDWAGQDEDYDMGTSIEKQNRLGRDSICVCVCVFVCIYIIHTKSISGFHDICLFLKECHVIEGLFLCGILAWTMC